MLERNVPVLFFVLGFVLCGIQTAIFVQPTKAAPENSVSYRVVDTMRGSTMEKEINELAELGCRPIFTIPAGAASSLGIENTVILECPNKNLTGAHERD